MWAFLQLQRSSCTPDIESRQIAHMVPIKGKRGPSRRKVGCNNPGKGKRPLTWLLMCITYSGDMHKVLVGIVLDSRVFTPTIFYQ